MCSVHTVISFRLRGKIINFYAGCQYQFNTTIKNKLPDWQRLSIFYIIIIESIITTRVIRLISDMHCPSQILATLLIACEKFMVISIPKHARCSRKATPMAMVSGNVKDVQDCYPGFDF